ncbi:MAG: 50S ribosomal protein L30e [Candidatus Micrarchaeota archaeon]
MDLNKSIRLAVDSGSVMLGVEKALKNAANNSAKVIVFVKTCPRMQDLKYYSELSGVPLIEFNGSSVELGAVCGKPFSVSALSVIEEGDSDILSVVTK